MSEEPKEEDLLDTLLRLAGEHARIVLVELKIRSLVPTWVLVSETEGLSIQSTPWGNDLEKRVFRKIIRHEMRAHKTHAYSFITEAWTVTLEPGEWDEATGIPKEGKRAFNHPARQEVVIACACTATEARWKQWRIVREPTTELILDLKEHPFRESTSPPESWMTEMLK